MRERIGPIALAARRAPGWSIPAATFIVAFALRIGLQWAVGFYSQGPIRWEYDTIARNIVQGGGYYYDFLGTRWVTYGLPIFPFIDAALYLLSGGTDRFVAIGVALAAFSAATAGIASLVALRLSGRAAAALAGAATAFHPPSLVYSTQVHELPLETLALALALVAFLADLRRPGRMTLAATVAAAAFATFVRPTYGAFALCAVLVLVLRRPAFAWRRALMTLAAMLLVSLPWTLRNAAAVGSTGTGLDPYSCYTLWIGNNPYATGTEITPDGRTWWEMQPPSVQAQIFGRPEVEQGRIFCAQMGEFIWADPVREVRFWLTKWSWFWWTSPSEGFAYPAAGLRLYLGAWLVAASLAVVGAAALWRSGRRWDLAIFLAMVVPISLAQAAAYVQGRHRIEIEWAVLILTAIGIVEAGRAVAALGGPAHERERPQVTPSLERT